MFLMKSDNYDVRFDVIYIIHLISQNTIQVNCALHTMKYHPRADSMFAPNQESALRLKRYIFSAGRQRFSGADKFLHFHFHFFLVGGSTRNQSWHNP